MKIFTSNNIDQEICKYFSEKQAQFSGPFEIEWIEHQRKFCIRKDKQILKIKENFKIS